MGFDFSGSWAQGRATVRGPAEGVIIFMSVGEGTNAAPEMGAPPNYLKSPLFKSLGVLVALRMDLGISDFCVQNVFSELFLRTGKFWLLSYK